MPRATLSRASAALKEEMKSLAASKFSFYPTESLLLQKIEVSRYNACHPCNVMIRNAPAAIAMDPT